MENKPILKSNKLTRLLTKVGATIMLAFTIFSVGCGKEEPTNPTPTPSNPNEPQQGVVVVDKVENISQLIAQKPTNLKEYLNDVLLQDMVESATGETFDESKIIYCSFDIGEGDKEQIDHVSLTFTYKNEDNTRTTYVVNATTNAKLEEVANYALIDYENFDGATDIKTEHNFTYDAEQNQRLQSFASQLALVAGERGEDLTIKYNGVKNNKFEYTLFANDNYGVREYTFQCPQALDTTNVTFTLNKEIKNESCIVVDQDQDVVADNYVIINNLEELKSSCQEEIDLFAQLQKSCVLQTSAINEEDVTSIKYKLIADEKGITGVTFEITSENEEMSGEYTIQTTFENPVSFSSIANQSKDIHSGNIVSHAITNAEIEEVSSSITEKQELTIEQILTDTEKQKIINENLFPILEAHISRTEKACFREYSADNIIDYKWALGEVDGNNSVQNLQVLVKYKISNTEVSMLLYNIELSEATSIYTLSENDNEPSSKKTTLPSYTYYYSIENQNKYHELLEQIIEKISQEDETFDYKNAQVYQGTWRASLGRFGGHLVFMSANGEIKELSISIAINQNATSEEQMLASAFQYLQQGDWSWGISSEVEMTTNQLNVVENQEQLQKE